MRRNRWMNMVVLLAQCWLRMTGVPGCDVSDDRPPPSRMADEPAADVGCWRGLCILAVMSEPNQSRGFGRHDAYLL
ncbi:hypothetical protein EV126DRAFT_429353 [Verticillium dahliae]|nr:hypothetical protein EV126DRAFT_429353 [Verticillium dahliae]